MPQQLLVHGNTTAWTTFYIQDILLAPMDYNVDSQKLGTHRHQQHLSYLYLPRIPHGMPLYSFHTFLTQKKISPNSSKSKGRQSFWKTGANTNYRHLDEIGSIANPRSHHTFQRPPRTPPELQKFDHRAVTSPTMTPRYTITSLPIRPRMIPTQNLTMIPLLRQDPK